MLHNSHPSKVHAIKTDMRLSSPVKAWKVVVSEKRKSGTLHLPKPLAVR
jgi:hypothetical protein